MTSGEPSGDRRALVTGASGGIGQAVVRMLAERGWRVIATGRDEARLRAAAGRARYVETVVADLRRPADCARLAAHVRSRWDALDLLVNNAGVAWLGSAGDLPDDALADQLAVNVQAPARLLRELLPLLRRPGRADVINVASEQALRPGPLNAAYGASKAALVYLTRAWAAELAASGVRVNCLMPGAVDTDMLARAVDPATVSVPLGRLLTPDDVAAWIPRLVEAELVTGAVVTVDGGTSL